MIAALDNVPPEEHAKLAGGIPHTPFGETVKAASGSIGSQS
jgi:hypothetical protein